MKQTAVQMVFSDLESKYPSIFNMFTQDGRDFVNHFHKYLAIEKQQLSDAYNHDRPNLCAYTEGTAFEEYHQETFKKS
jgi:hypothetical protein